MDIGNRASDSILKNSVPEEDPVNGLQRYYSASNYYIEGLHVDSRGYVKYKQGVVDSNNFWIRPAGTICPGDDILLCIDIYKKVGARILRKAMSENDYFAVYDKKLLWRANLYIDEGKGKDWNELHSWVLGNDWNRTFDGVTHGAPGSGNGKQVVNFSGLPWTPVRTKLAGVTNYYDDRVAYDYEHVAPTFKAMDSPFDFLWKLNRQRSAIKNHFTPLADNSVADFPSGRKNPQGQDINIQLPQQGQLKNKDLENWATGKGVYNQWKYYWKEPSPAGTRAYIPGLGFRFHSGGGTTEANTAPGVDLDFSDRASAGADCIGFVQRTASYIGNTYKWENCPTDLAEGRKTGHCSAELSISSRRNI